MFDTKLQSLLQIFPLHLLENFRVKKYSYIHLWRRLFYLMYHWPILCLHFCSTIAWSKSCSLSCCNFPRRWEKGMAHIGLGQHYSREPVTIGISCKLDSLRTSSSSSKPIIHINLLESFEIWPPFNYYSHCYWFDTHKMIKICCWTPKGSCCRYLHTRKIDFLIYKLKGICENIHICKWVPSFLFWAFVSNTYVISNLKNRRPNFSFGRRICIAWF